METILSGNTATCKCGFLVCGEFLYLKLYLCQQIPWLFEASHYLETCFTGRHINYWTEKCCLHGMVLFKHGTVIFESGQLLKNESGDGCVGHYVQNATELWKLL